MIKKFLIIIFILIYSLETTGSDCLLSIAQTRENTLRPPAAEVSQGRITSFLVEPPEESNGFVGDLLTLDDVTTYVEVCEFLKAHPDKFVAKLHIIQAALEVIIKNIEELKERLKKLDSLTGMELHHKYLIGDGNNAERIQQDFAALVYIRAKIDNLLSSAGKFDEEKKARILEHLNEFLFGAIGLAYLSSDLYFGITAALSTIFKGKREELARPEIAAIAREIYFIEKAACRFAFHCYTLIRIKGYEEKGMLKSNVSVKNAIDEILKVIKVITEILCLSGRYDFSELIFDTTGVDEQLTLEFDMDVASQYKDAIGYQFGLLSIICDIVKNAVISMTDRDKKIIKGKITIKAFREGNTRKIIISDNGPGIPPEILDKIFIPGFTTENEVSLKPDPLPKGYGTGLSKVAVEVRFLGGEISVESRHISKYPERHGSTFTVTLPATISTATATTGLKIYPEQTRFNLLFSQSALRPMAGANAGAIVKASGKRHLVRGADSLPWYKKEPLFTRILPAWLRSYKEDLRGMYIDLSFIIDCPRIWFILAKKFRLWERYKRLFESFEEIYPQTDRGNFILRRLLYDAMTLDFLYGHSEKKG